jgi:hypothetical protein
MTSGQDGSYFDMAHGAPVNSGRGYKMNRPPASALAGGGRTNPARARRPKTDGTANADPFSSSSSIDSRALQLCMVLRRDSACQHFVWSALAHAHMLLCLLPESDGPKHGLLDVNGAAAVVAGQSRRSANPSPAISRAVTASKPAPAALVQAKHKDKEDTTSGYEASAEEDSGDRARSSSPAAGLEALMSALAVAPSQQASIQILGERHPPPPPAGGLQ